jgi:hypothetical protein
VTLDRIPIAVTQDYTKLELATFICIWWGLTELALQLFT